VEKSGNELGNGNGKTTETTPPPPASKKGWGLPNADWSSKAAAEAKLDFEWSVGTDYKWTRGWAKELSNSYTLGFSRSQTSSTSFSLSETMTKGAYAKKYCGAWYAVPYVGVACGRGARGTPDNEGWCNLYKEEAAFDFCFQSFIPDPLTEVKSKSIFVLKDCEHNYILPGEWQHPAFGQSMSVGDVTETHVARWGLINSKKRQRPMRNEKWERGETLELTTEWGPRDDYTLRMGLRDKYFVNYKLRDGECFDFPRNYVQGGTLDDQEVATKSVDLDSAETTEGNCCVLFSRHECFGLPQVVNGKLGDLEIVGFKGQPHSVVCNVPEYCDPARAESMSL